MDRLSAAWVDSYTFVDLGVIPVGQGFFSRYRRAYGKAEIARCRDPRVGILFRIVFARAF